MHRFGQSSSVLTLTLGNDHVIAGAGYFTPHLARARQQAPPRKHPVNQAKFAIGLNHGTNVNTSPIRVAANSALIATGLKPLVYQYRPVNEAIATVGVLEEVRKR